MRKLLIVNGHLRVGGVEKSLLNLLRSVDYSRYQVDLLLMEGEGTYRNDIPKDVNVICLRMEEAYGSFVKVLLRAVRTRDLRLLVNRIAISLYSKTDGRHLGLLRLFSGLQPYYDAAIAYRTDVPAAFVAFQVRAGKKLIWWHNGQYDISQATTEKWYKAFRKADAIVCVSEFTRRMITPHYPECQPRMTVIPNMLDLTELSEKSIQWNPYEAVEDKTVIVSVGRLSAEKHLLDCVEAARMLAATQKTDFVWYFVGDGPERAAIEAKIREYGLEQRVILVGNQSNPYPYIRYADLFVHASHVESQGLAVLEAMALGKLCVVVESDGVKEFALDGQNAFTAVKSVEALYRKIVEALEFPEKSSIAMGAVSTAADFSKESVMKKIYGLIE